MAFIHRELRHKLHLYARKGGKKSRRRQVERIELFVEWCHRPAEQIGRRQAHEFFQAHNFAPTTARDYYYAICKLWTLLGRGGKPPSPPILGE